MKNPPTKEFLDLISEYYRIFTSVACFNQVLNANSLSDFIGFLEHEKSVCTTCGRNLNIEDHYKCPIDNKDAGKIA